MRLLIVSDTHGNDTALIKAYDQAGLIDGVIHLGDGEQDTLLLETLIEGSILKVAGNCDLGSSAPRELLVTLEGRRILLTHGDRYTVKSGLAQLVARGKDAGADLVLYGHTHLARIEEQDGLLLLNPGTLWSCSSFQSYAILETNANRLKTTICELT